MLNGIKIYSSNPVWRHILSELGATVTDVPNVLDINFDEIEPGGAVSATELKSIILQYADATNILQNIFHRDMPQLSDIQQSIIISLWRSGGMSGNELKNVLGYLPGVSTHSIDTAIYNLRKLFGHDFIKLEKGVYKIGNV